MIAKMKSYLEMMVRFHEEQLGEQMNAGDTTLYVEGMLSARKMDLDYLALLQEIDDVYGAE